MKMKDHIWQIIGVVAVLAIGASVAYSNAVSNQANEGIEFEAHIRGNADASVTLTEYSDFQCPACGQFYTIVEDVLAKYGDDIRLEYKHFPLVSIHPFATPAAKAAEAAGQQGKFFQMHDKLFENQQVWSKSANPQVFFNTYAEEIGLDVGLFKNQMKSSLIDEKIKDEFNQARGLGLNSTPSFFLNGKKMQFETYEDFINQITAEINSVKGETNDNTTDLESSSTDAKPEVRFGF